MKNEDVTNLFNYRSYSSTGGSSYMNGSGAKEPTSSLTGSFRRSASFHHTIRENSYETNTTNGYENRRTSYEATTTNGYEDRHTESPKGSSTGSTFMSKVRRRLLFIIVALGKIIKFLWPWTHHHHQPHRLSNCEENII